MTKSFYVYEHWRPDRDECFYVGKGSGARANSMKNRNRMHKFIQAKLSRLGMCVEVRLVADGLAEDEAYALEIQRIAFWRASGLDLANMTMGGEGSPSGRIATEDTRQRMSVWQKGKPKNPETMEKIAAKKRGVKKGPMPQAHKDAISRAKKGETHRPEWNAKVKAALAGRQLPPASEERKRKISEKLKAFHARRREVKMTNLDVGDSDMTPANDVNEAWEGR